MKNIRIDTNKNNKKVAYEITSDLRNIRMSLTEAELLISTGNVLSVTYGPNPFQYGVAYIGTEQVNGVSISHTGYTL